MTQRNIFLLSVVFLLNLSLIIGAAPSLTHIDTARHAMVVAARGEAVEAGREMLRQGGNAVDAAVAAAFVIGVVEPYASGLGGGGGMLIYRSDQKEIVYLDYYMQAPARVDTSLLMKENRETPRVICIPGTPSGLLTAVTRYGRLPRQEVMRPAIELARRGFTVTDVFFEAVLEKLELILQNPSLGDIFLKDGMPYPAGDTMVMAPLATLMDSLGVHGEDYFYRGKFSRDAAHAIQENGGGITAEDFSHYQTLLKKPVDIDYRGYRIYSSPPPQSGITLLQILSMVERSTWRDWLSFERSAPAIYQVSEVINLADADRFAFLADPRFSQVPVRGLLHPDYARERLAGIDTAQIGRSGDIEIRAGDPWKYQPDTPTFPGNPADSPDSRHTTHISVIDGEGNMVSLTQTLGVFFGSGFCHDGVIFNSGITNFSRRGVNRLEANKRPRSTISPTIITQQSRPLAVLGTPGGGTIFNVMAELIIRLIDFRESPVAAVYAPRFSSRVTARQITMENRFEPEILKELENRGYEVRLVAPFEILLGGVQLILYDEKLQRFIGVSDPRRGGVAGGL